MRLPYCFIICHTIFAKKNILGYKLTTDFSDEIKRSRRAMSVTASLGFRF